MFDPPVAKNCDEWFLIGAKLSLTSVKQGLKCHTHTQETLCTGRDFSHRQRRHDSPDGGARTAPKTTRKAFSIRLCYDREIGVLHLRLYVCCSQVLICATEVITLILKV